MKVKKYDGYKIILQILTFLCKWIVPYLIIMITLIYINFLDWKDNMDSTLIGTIAGVGGAILVAIITLIGTIISSNKSISKKNSDQHSTQNIEHAKILEKQESYVKTIDSTRTKVENINTMLSVLKERDDFKNSLVSTDVSKSLTAVINTFGEQSLEISELKKDNVVLKTKIEELKKSNKILEEQNNKLELKIKELDKAPSLTR